MSIYEKLYDYQKNIVDKFKNRKSFGLWLDCGLGKTPLALAFAEINRCEKILIVTINSKALEKETVSGSWLNWATKLSEHYEFYDKRILKNKKSFDSKSNEIFIVNYESLSTKAGDSKKSTLHPKVIDFIKGCYGKNLAIILDESHKVKTANSSRSLAVNKVKELSEKIAKNCYTYLLTGTPFTEGYEDVHNQLKILGCTMSKTAFLDKFCIRGNVYGLLGWQQPIVGYKNLNELYDLVHKYAITINSEDVLDLPEKVFIEHTVNGNEAFKLLSQEKLEAQIIRNEMNLRNLPFETDKKPTVKINNPFYRNMAYPNEEKWLAETAAAFWMRCRQISIGFQGNEEDSCWYDNSRLKELKKLLEEHPDNYLIFYNYTPELLELYDICYNLGYNVDVYCGEIKSTTFYEKYASQSESDRLTNKMNVIISNYASGGTGMNWQCYDKCILFSLPLFKDWTQSLKRIHRSGQKNTTIYHLFLGNNWLDRSMKEALEEGVQYNDKMFESDLKRVKLVMGENL